MDLKERVLIMSGVDVRKCMACGKCSGACPSYSEMEYHPHQFVSMVKNGNIEPLMKSESAIRLLAVRPQGSNHIKADDIPSLLDPELPQQAIVTAFRKYSK